MYLCAGVGSVTNRAAERLADPWTPMAAGHDEFATACSALYPRDAVRLVDIDGEKRVLDVAADTGVASFEAADRGAKVRSTDFAPGMLDFLRARVAERKYPDIEVNPSTALRPCR